MSISRKFLLPISPIYGLVTKVRNICYDKKVFNSRSYPIPIICVGNLSVGGTGKSPMVEYLIDHISKYHRIATLSRGYGRSTKGFRLLDENDTAENVGDEPLQFKNKFPNINVAVDENRQRGITELLKTANPEVIILDDAFQHRRVQAGLNILLTSYGDLYTDDLLLPAGNLREPISGAKRAGIVVVTKCPRDLSEKEQAMISRKLKLQAHQNLFFSYINYSSEIYNGKESIPLTSLAGKKITLVTGIANPKPLLDHLRIEKIMFEHLRFPDHYNFKEKDLEKFSGEIILTTEKDYMRLKSLNDNFNLFYIPISLKFIKDPEKFEKLINQYILNEK
ncbi:MAG TPA: tetraacyldisaccharide 4'-kinase [Gillisia sp.]|nr:tetraacyldisaccharide 4'-kinase [Gillisia sp.]